MVWTYEGPVLFWTAPKAKDEMEKCCGSISDATGGSTRAECEGFTQRTFKTGLYHLMSSEA